MLVKPELVTSARRKKRIQKVLKRKARLQVLTRRAGSLAQKIYKCGLHPAAMYGDEVSSISDVEWRSMQRLASTAHSPLTADRSLSALWLWCEDPTTSSVIAPIFRWSKEVWLAATHPRGETGEYGQFLKVLNSYFAKSLGAGQIATTRALAKCERPRWCNISDPGQDKMDLVLSFSSSSMTTTRKSC